MAKPPGSLGLLEYQMKKLYCCWGELPKDLNPCHLIFAADNGIAEEGVVRQPQQITYLQSKNMVNGKATISCFCKKNQIPYKVIDVGIANAASVGYNRKIALGTKNFLKEPAMQLEEYNKAFAVGEEMICQAKEEKYNIISFGEMGIGNTTTSSAVLYALSGIQPDLIVGYGANKNNPEVIKRKCEVIKDGFALYKEQFYLPADIIRCVGGFDIAAMCGAMIECVRRKLPFMLDGFITAVAFACAVRMCPKVKEYAFASHISREPGMVYALKLGGIMEEHVPIRAQLALGEGTGTVFAIVMLRTMLDAVWNVSKVSEFEAKLLVTN